MGWVGAVRNRLAVFGRWLKRRGRRSPARAVEHGDAVLRALARRASCSVQEVASRLGLPLADAAAARVTLEGHGLVRLSKDRIEANRIAAVTRKGREELRALGLPPRTRP